MGDVREKLKRIREIRSECVDAIIDSPQSRTNKVLEILKKQDWDEATNWDLICFSIFYLASQLVVVPDLKQEVESLSLKLMWAHYLNGGEFGLYNEQQVQELTRARYNAELAKEEGEKPEIKL